LRNLIILSLPIMLSNFVQTVYNATDAWWLGKLGEEARYAVAATGIAFPVIFFINSFGFGFVVAGTALISRFRGADQPDRIRQVTGQFIMILAVVLPVYLVLSQVVMGLLLRILSVPDAVMPYAGGYMRMAMLGMGFNFIFLAFQSASHGLGDTVTPMKVLVATVLLNIVLDPLLIFGVGPFPALGTLGAGIATMISRLLAAVIAVFVVLRRHGDLLPKKGELKFHLPTLKTIFKISIPASVAQSITSFGFLVLIGFVNSFGAAVISVYTINNRLTSLFMMPAMGISNGLSAIIGQNLGAGNRRRARASVGVAMLLVSIIMGGGALLLFFNGAHFTRFFIDDDEVVEAGARMFKIACWASFVFGAMFVFFGVFNGAGDTMPNMVLNITRLWLLRLPLTFLLSGRLAQYIAWPWIQPLLARAAIPLARYPYDALWWSMLASNIICAGVAALIYARGKWQYRKV